MAEVTTTDGEGVISDVLVESPGQRLNRVTTAALEKAEKEMEIIEEKDAMKRAVMVFGDRMWKLTGMTEGAIVADGLLSGKLEGNERNTLQQAELKLGELGLSGWREGAIAGGQELVRRIKERYGAVLGEGGDEAAWQEVLSDSPELSVLSNNPGYWEDRPINFNELVAKRKGELLELGRSPMGKTVSEIASRFIQS